MTGGRLARQPGARLQLEQFRRQILRLADVVETRERVAQPLSPVKVQTLRLVERQTGHARPSRFRRRPQNLLLPAKLYIFYKTITKQKRKYVL